MISPDPPVQDIPPQERVRPANRLGNEKSPYLIQHAHNPVDWYPWGTEAFGRAAAEDKPVFLSIGYATCHWCHVMAHESFEDETVARLLNESFICIKVDREERPDIDSVYMAVCQMMTGAGGWPLTIVMTPEKKPFFAGTYFPREARFGLPGLLDLLPRLSAVWKEDRAVLLGTAGAITEALGPPSPPDPSPVPDRHVFESVFHDLGFRFDSDCGGFGNAPKFPSPYLVMFLLRHWNRTGNPRALAMATKTLDHIRNGGIYDQIGFGVHRYSVDACWQVPHFEKMLYDQALLAIAYTEAYQATKNPEYRRAAEEILTYMLRDMASPQGAFYSAEDADSEGREGAYYVWTNDELVEVLGQDDAALAMAVFCDEGTGKQPAGGDSGTGMILRRSGAAEKIAFSHDMTGDELAVKTEEIRAALFSARTQRPRPERDDKILADWNGFAIAALARAARAFGVQNYADAGRRAARFVLDVMHNPGGGLFHRFRDGEAAIPAFADDYTGMVWGLIELYQATFDDSYITAAAGLNRYFMEHFEDGTHGGFFTTSDTSEQVLVRRKEVWDGAVPSCNSVALHNLLRLARLTGEYRLEKTAAALSGSVFALVKHALSGSASFACALDFAFGPSHEVVITGDLHNPDTRALIDACNTDFLPSVTVLFRPPGSVSTPFPDASGHGIPYSPDAKAAAYICSRNACISPVTNPYELRRILGVRSP